MLKKNNKLKEYLKNFELLKNDIEKFKIQEDDANNLLHEICNQGRKNPTNKELFKIYQLLYEYIKNLQEKRIWSSIIIDIPHEPQQSTTKITNRIKHLVDLLTSKSEKYYDINKEKYESVRKMQNNDNDNSEIIMEHIRTIEQDNIAIKKDVEWLSRVFMPTIIALAGLLVTVSIFGFNSLNSSVSSKFEVIQQQLESQKELNQVQIQKEVSQEFLRQKKGK